MEKIHNINGKKYIIDIENNEIKGVFIEENNQRRTPNYDELFVVIKMYNNKLNELSKDSVLFYITSKIDHNEFKTMDEIHNYLNSITLNPDVKKEIIAQTNNYITQKFNNNVSTRNEKVQETPTQSYEEPTNPMNPNNEDPYNLQEKGFTGQEINELIEEKGFIRKRTLDNNNHSGKMSRGLMTVCFIIGILLIAIATYLILR